MEFPQIFDKYTLLKRIATGGMAEIFRARQRGVDGFEKDVVIKRILSNHAQNEELNSMFLDEARIAANLNHPNIAQIFDLGHSKSGHFIAMEYARGVDLRRICAQGIAESNFLPLSHALKIMIEVCNALAYAHEHKNASGAPAQIVHRDVSPTNILVTYDGNIKLVDFGIAKAAHKATVTRIGQIKGKFGYMSPEQARGEPLDHRTDIFAVGINLYEITLGRRLFRGESEVAMLEAIERCYVTPPREHEPRYPEKLEAIIMKALARRPEERYSNARALQMALESFQAEAGLHSSSGMLASYMRLLFKEQIELEEEEDRQLLEVFREAEEEVPALISAEGTPSLPIPLAPTPLAQVVQVSSLHRSQEISLDQLSPPIKRELRPASKTPSDPWAIDLSNTPAPQPSAFKVPPPDPLEFEEEIKIKKHRSYAGLLWLLLIAGGVYVLYYVMNYEYEHPRERGDPNIQVSPPRLQDFNKGIVLPEAPPPKKGLVRLESDPPGARVVVNSNLINSITPTAVQSFAGQWISVRMLLPGYLPAEKRMKLEGDEGKIHMTLREGEPPTGAFDLESFPPGAMVSLNGAELGLTPLRLPKVAAGAELTFRLQKEGYYPHTLSYTLQKGQEMEVGLRLVPDSGPRTMAIINVQSLPLGAEISHQIMGGELKKDGRTSRFPIQINTPIDRQISLKAVAKDQNQVEAIVDVHDPFYTLYLSPPQPEIFFGQFSLLGTRKLVVYVGSEEIGRSPIRKKKLKEGEHTVIVLDEESGARQEFQIVIERSKTLRKSAVLKDGAITIR